MNLTECAKRRPYFKDNWEMLADYTQGKHKSKRIPLILALCLAKNCLSLYTVCIHCIVAQIFPEMLLLFLRLHAKASVCEECECFSPLHSRIASQALLYSYQCYALLPGCPLLRTNNLVDPVFDSVHPLIHQTVLNKP